MTPFNFRHGGKLYRLAPDARLACAVEDELGALPTLATRFRDGTWHLTELLTLMQMFLQASGESADFYLLGDEILRGGLAAPLAAVRRFLAPFDEERTTP